MVPGGGSLYGDEVEREQVVWMSHGDEALELPSGFEIVARRVIYFVHKIIYLLFSVTRAQNVDCEVNTSI